MGVVSNGMLCSGDELGLTSRRRRDPHPAGRTRRSASPLTDLYGDVVLDVDVKPNRGDALSIVGLAREVAAVTGGPLRFPPTEVEESGRPTAERLRVEVEEPDLCPRFVGRWVSGVTIGPSPDRIQMRLLAAGMRPISNVVDASNYVMLELGKPIHTFDAATVARRPDRRPARAAAASASRRSTTSCATCIPRRCSSPTRPGRSAIAGVMGGAELRGRSRDDRRRRRVGDLRPGQHPPDGLPLRPAVRGEPALREGPGVPPGPPRRRPDRPPDRRMGRRHRRARRRRLESRRAGTGPGRVPAGPRQPPARDDARGRRAARAARPRRDREPTPAGAGTTVAGRRRHAAARWSTPARTRSSTRRPDLAARPRRRDGHRRGGHPRPRLRARARRSCPHTPMPPYRHDPLELRDAVRETLAGAGLTEVVTFALVSPRDVERFPAVDDGAPDGGTGAAGASAGRSPSRTRSRASTPSCASGCSAACSTSCRRTCGTAARRSRSSRSARATARRGDRPTHEWWRLGFALTGPAEPPAWNRPARPYDLDDAKGVHRARLPAPRLRDAGLRARSTDDPNLHPGRSGPRDPAGGERRRPGRGAPSRRRSRRSTSAPSACSWPSSPIAGLAGGQPGRPSVRDAVAPAVRRTRPRGRRALETTGRGRRGRDPAPRRGAAARTSTLFDIYRGRPLQERDKSLAYRLTLRDDERTLTEAEVDAAVGAVVAGLAADLGARFRT